MPIKLPDKVTVTLSGGRVEVKGPKGVLAREVPDGVDLKVADGEVVVTRLSDQRRHRALHGLTRALVNNMVLGVSTGFVRELEIVGVGYRAESKDGKTAKFNLGYSHPIVMEMPEGVAIEVLGKGDRIKISGIDKEVLGQTAANIRGLRPPEPYKGKGIKYVEEKLRRKVGKAGAGTA
jgi:large subunit ribosomal protein L6